MARLQYFSRVRRSLIAACAISALTATSALAPVAAVQAKPRKTRAHALTLTATFRALEAISARFVATGVISGAPFGNGALVRQVLAAPSNINSLTVTFTIFTSRGTVVGTAAEQKVDNADGSVSFTVSSARITGGTGRYRRARGQFTGSGTEPSRSVPVTERLTGHVSF